MNTDSDILLAPGEQGLEARKVRPNLVLFWLNTTLMITNKRIAVKYPNSLFGIIPLGFEENSMPMGSIAGVQTSLRVKIWRVILGGILALWCLVEFLDALSDGDVGVAFLWGLATAFFAAIALTGIQSGLVITNNGGGKIRLGVSFLDKQPLEDFKNKANEFIYSASTGGSSWEMQYGANQEGFQNRFNPTQQAPFPGPNTNGAGFDGYGGLAQGGYGQPPEGHSQWGQQNFGGSAHTSEFGAQPFGSPQQSVSDSPNYGESPQNGNESTQFEQPQQNSGLNSSDGSDGQPKSES